jgi:hypothetical protein
METQTISNKYITLADLTQLLDERFGTDYEVDVC